MFIPIASASITVPSSGGYFVHFVSGNDIPAVLFQGEKQKLKQGGLHWFSRRQPAAMSPCFKFCNSKTGLSCPAPHLPL
jgi:hypothetical protein